MLKNITLSHRKDKRNYEGKDRGNMPGDPRSRDMNNGRESTGKDNLRFTSPDNSNRSACLRPRGLDNRNSRGSLRFKDKDNRNSGYNLRFRDLVKGKGRGCLRLSNLSSVNPSVCPRLRGT
ncbi:MAG: hypothetical protein ACOWYE_07970 [Desulfatiglandales bacterium]